MHGYTPGEQPALGERVIKLNTNENPFPPSPKVITAIQNVEPEMLRRYNGTPAEALENPELMELVLPVLRADLALCKSYIYTPEPPFSFSVTAFGGLDDHRIPRLCIEGWHEHTTGPFALRMLPGDHFFLNTSRLPLLEAISKELEQDMREKRMGHCNAS